MTSATWSTALERPIALAIVRRQHADAGTAVSVRAGDGDRPRDRIRLCRSTSGLGHER